MEFVPSKKLGHADGLSRLIPKYCEPLEDSVIAALRTENENNSSVINLIRELPVTLDEIIEEAESDEYIKEIKEKLRSEDQLISEVFSICNDVLMYRERVVIPATLQKRILKDFHVGHPGATRMKSLMRSYVFWKNMDRNIEETVKACKGCALAAKAPPIQFTPWPKTHRP